MCVSLAPNWVQPTMRVPNLVPLPTQPVPAHIFSQIAALHFPVNSTHTLMKMKNWLSWIPECDRVISCMVLPGCQGKPGGTSNIIFMAPSLWLRVSWSSLDGGERDLGHRTPWGLFNQGNIEFPESAESCTQRWRGEKSENFSFLF